MKAKEIYKHGTIFDIQHFSLHDGPGIRTIVFFKGCPLKCRWCHNPESISIKPALSFHEQKCIGCGKCFEVCPNNVHIAEDGRHKIHRDTCDACGICVQECPSAALELSGQKVTAKDVIDEVLKDKIFYENSGGGLTLSGGEPMMQFDFAYEILDMAKQNNLNTAIETCGYSKFENYKRIAQKTDLFLFDYKGTDDDFHIKFTGKSNILIQENLRKLNELGVDILLRCPVIHQTNDTDNHFRTISEITLQYEHVIGAELLPYHRLGISKIERFGLDKKYFHEFKTANDETENAWMRKVKSFGGILI